MSLNLEHIDDATYWMIQANAAHKAIAEYKTSIVIKIGSMVEKNHNDPTIKTLIDVRNDLNRLQLEIESDSNKTLAEINAAIERDEL